MRPSFFSLFQRSNYYHRASIDLETRSDSSNEARRERKEVERYIVAAIAFCLQHDREFRNCFFAATCSYKRDPPLGRWSIEVEPHAWGDLVIRNRTTSGHFVYAVECKVGAVLDHHQNPDKRSFRGKKGYGRVLSATEKEAELRYTVLGYRGPPLRLPRFFPKLRLRVGQRHWADVVAAYSPKEGITLDLFNSLGHIAIPEFSYRHTDKMKIGTNALDAAKAGEVITHTAEKLGILSEYMELEPWFESKQDWCFGYILKKLPPRQGKSPNQRQLMRIVDSDAGDGEIGWFGYEPDGAKGRKLSVYLYCGGKKPAAKVERQLLPKFQQVTVKGREDSNLVDVVVSTNEHSLLSDRDWFLSVFETLGLKANRIA